jgi:type IV pilus assembly protein PilC
MWINRNKEIALFYEKMAQSYRSGLPLIESLTMASMGVSDSKIKRSLELAKGCILSGHTLTKGLAQSPMLFSELDLALIDVGESQGRLDQALLGLSALYEKQYKDIKIFLFAMAYPTFLLSAAIFLPPIVNLFTDGMEAYVSIVFSKLFTIGTPVAAIYAGYYAFRTYAPDKLDYTLLQIPIIGANLKKLALARFCRSLATLFSGGVDLHRSIKLSIKSMANAYLEQRSRIIAVALDEGRTVSEGLRAAKIFPESFVNSFAIGEETGDIDQILTKVAEYYEFEADKAFKAILSATPIIIYLFVAAYIGYIVISFYTGYFKIIGDLTK